MKFPQEIVAEESQKRNRYVGQTLRVFISYSTADKLKAGAIKDGLNHFGIDAYVAHDDITGGEEWRTSILNNLKKCDLFIPLISENFSKSDYANQEVGFAICKEIPIIPISLDGKNPYGFLEMFQAIKNFKFEELHFFGSQKTQLDCKDSIFNLLSIILAKPSLKESMKDCLIRSLNNMWSYAMAERQLNLLESLENFTNEQANEIIIQSIDNSQIHDAYKCKPILRKFIDKYDIEQPFLDEIKRIIK